MRPEIACIFDEEILTTTTDKKNRGSLSTRQESYVSPGETLTSLISDNMAKRVENSTRVQAVELSDFIRFLLK